MNSNVQNSISMPELKSCFLFLLLLLLLVLHGHSGKVVNQHKTIVLSKIGKPKSDAIKLPVTVYYKIQPELTFSKILKQSLCAFFLLIRPSLGF